MTDLNEGRATNPRDRLSVETKQLELRPINDEKILAELILNTLRLQIQDGSFLENTQIISEILAAEQKDLPKLIGQFIDLTQLTSGKLQAVQNALRFIVQHKVVAHNDTVIDLNPFSASSYDSTKSVTNADEGNTHLLPSVTYTAQDPEVLAKIKSDPVRFSAYLFEEALENYVQQRLATANGLGDHFIMFPQRNVTTANLISGQLSEARSNLTGIEGVLHNITLGTPPTFTEISRKESSQPMGYRLNLTPTPPPASK